MIKRSSQALAAWFLTWDLSITASAWVGAYFLRFDSGWIPVTTDGNSYNPDLSAKGEIIMEYAPQRSRIVIRLRTSANSVARPISGPGCAGRPGTRWFYMSKGRGQSLNCPRRLR